MAAGQGHRKPASFERTYNQAVSPLFTNHANESNTGTSSRLYFRPGDRRPARCISSFAWRTASTPGLWGDRVGAPCCRPTPHSLRSIQPPCLYALGATGNQDPKNSEIAGGLGWASDELAAEGRCLCSDIGALFDARSESPAGSKPLHCQHQRLFHATMI